jgi:uridine kinase
MSYLIGIAGPSTSGKTTICKALEKHFPDAFVETQDIYWHDKKTFPKTLGFRNWERPENVDFEMLYQNLKDFKEDKSSILPMFTKMGRAGLRTVPAFDLVVYEGFLLFQDERISDLFDLKFYIDISEEEIIKRRMTRNRSGKEGRELYYREVLVEEYRPFKELQAERADYVIDGTISSEENLAFVVEKITEHHNFK